jgi:colanic acid biosynthesis protein WcaH
MLPVDVFKSIVRYTPLISMDIIVSNKKGEILLGKRNNRPAQGCWFVPGGRILKDERMNEAFGRLSMQELGMKLNLDESKFLGPFEHHYQDNFSGDDFSTHYVVLAFKVVLDMPLESLPDQQHAEYRWFTEKELLACADVHQHTRWYFQAEKYLS